jgi:WD40 repeat protein
MPAGDATNHFQRPAFKRFLGAAATAVERAMLQADALALVAEYGSLALAGRGQAERKGPHGTEDAADSASDTAAAAAAEEEFVGCMGLVSASEAAFGPAAGGGPVLAWNRALCFGATPAEAALAPSAEAASSGSGRGSSGANPNGPGVGAGVGAGVNAGAGTGLPRWGPALTVGRPVADVSWSARFPELLLVAYAPGSVQSNRAALSEATGLPLSSRLSPGLVVVWNLLFPSRPEKVFVSGSAVTVARFVNPSPGGPGSAGTASDALDSSSSSSSSSPSAAAGGGAGGAATGALAQTLYSLGGYIVAGTANGGLVVWDVRQEEPAATAGATAAGGNASGNGSSGSGGKGSESGRGIQPLFVSPYSPRCHLHPVVALFFRGLVDTPFAAAAHAQQMDAAGGSSGGGLALKIASLSCEGRVCEWTSLRLAGPASSLKIQYHPQALAQGQGGGAVPQASSEGKDVLPAAADFSPSGSNAGRLHVGSQEGALLGLQCTVQKTEVLYRFLPHTGVITAVAHSPSADLLLTASLDWSVKLWSTAKAATSADAPTLLRTFDFDGPVEAAAWSPVQPAVFATAGADGCVSVFLLTKDTEAPAARAWLPRRDVLFSNAPPSLQGYGMAGSGAQGAVSAVAAAAAASAGGLRGGLRGVTRLCWSADGRRLLVGDVTGRVSVLELLAPELTTPRADDLSKLRSVLGTAV